MACAWACACSDSYDLARRKVLPFSCSTAAGGPTLLAGRAERDEGMPSALSSLAFAPSACGPAPKRLALSSELRCA